MARSGGSDGSPSPTISPKAERQRDLYGQAIMERAAAGGVPAAQVAAASAGRVDESRRSNPNFAATAVNRVWQYLCGRGLAGSVEELDRVSPEERRVLDELAELFVAAGYDLRWLIAGICKSKVYQQAAAPARAWRRPRCAGR